MQNHPERHDEEFPGSDRVRPELDGQHATSEGSMIGASGQLLNDRVGESEGSNENSEQDPGDAIPHSDRHEYPFWGWTDALLFLGVMVMLLVVMVVIASGLHLMGFIGMAPAAIIAQGLAMGVALLGLSRLFRVRYAVRLRDALHLNAPQKVPQFVLLGVATAMMVAILGAVLKLSEMDMPMKELIRTDFDLLMVGIGAVTFGPLFEELVFRGFLQPLFGKLLGAIPGIFATSLLFAMPHGPQYGWHWQHLLVITAAGAVFGFIRWKTASTTASTIAHSAYNALLVLVAFLQRANLLDG